MSVQPIDRRVVHQICSGQVVLNLATAVKELIENSLDAGATVIDIKLREYGSEQVEVIDNASGIEESNFEGLTLKHHTSKLRDFSDLSNVDTFGFRGEALSSLCALSDLCITTCHKSSSVGTKIVYDQNGAIRSKCPCPRQQGTTICLQNLFYTLPVRHKEFLRNVKKEFTKMVQLLQAYCIISSGVKITCTNQTGNGKKTPIIITHGNTLTKENIMNIFGPKQVQSLLELEQVTPDTDICEEYGLKTEQTKQSLFRITGYISKPDHKEGRSSTDRQYYYINKRPCDFPKVSKLVNEVYHVYNRNQCPFVVMDISLAKDSVDVNLTPDKRKILVQEEKTLLAIVKTSLHKMFAPRSSMYDVSQQSKPSSPAVGNLSGMFGRAVQRSGDSPSNSQGSGYKLGLAGLKRSFSAAGGNLLSDSSAREAKQPKLDVFFLKRSKSDSSSSSGISSASSPSVSSPSISSPSISSQSSSGPQDCIGSQALSSQESKDEELYGDSVHSTSSETSHTNLFTLNKTSSEHTSSHTPTKDSITGAIMEDRVNAGDVSNETYGGDLHSMKEIITDKTISEAQITFETNVKSEKDIGSGPTGEDVVEVVAEMVSQEESHKIENVANIKKTKMPMGQTDCPVDVQFTKKQVTIPFSIHGLKNKKSHNESKSDTKQEFEHNFRAKIKPSDNVAAENELKKIFEKDSFNKMEIIGQFNLGFIIAKLKSDLFIIDQHATDEKYNFEDLQKNTVLQSQRLIQPMRLELTAVNEMILKDNLEIFHKNGFEFSMDEEAPPTERVKLTSAPVSKNWTFGKDDIDEMIFMLSDAPGTMVRPSRIRQMFASRSCRKSVMIGTALNKAEMTKLVGHMSDLDQPWNCPHGRPTFRHLFNLSLLPD